MTRVLPLPAPARTSSGPSPAVTASRCAGFRSSSRRSNDADTTRLYPSGTNCARDAKSHATGQIVTDDLTRMAPAISIFNAFGTAGPWHTPCPFRGRHEKTPHRRRQLRRARRAQGVLQGSLRGPAGAQCLAGAEHDRAADTGPGAAGREDAGAGRPEPAEA